MSTQDVVCLGTRGEKGIRQREILWKIAQGREYVFCGSQLVYKETKRKWFAHIAYRIKKEVKPELIQGEWHSYGPRRNVPGGCGSPVIIITLVARPASLSLT